MDDIAGIDGCKAGWIIASTSDVVVVPQLRLDQFDLAGIDMPMGLSNDAPRACDIAARKYLGHAGSCVFPAPPRVALAHSDYQAALAAARQATGRGISKQTFNIMRKVAELDVLIDAATQHRVVEVHPECSFRFLNGDESLPTKKSLAGRVARRQLLLNHFDVPSSAPRGAAIDDMLDAFAVLWSAQRFARGEHKVFGGGLRDERGIEMRIVC